MAGTLIIASQAEVQADTFCMANMQIAVGLGRKPGAYECVVDVALLMNGGRAGAASPLFIGVSTRSQVVVNNGADKGGSRGRTGGSGHTYVIKVSGEVSYFAMFRAVCRVRGVRVQQKCRSASKLWPIMTHTTLWLAQIQFFSAFGFMLLFLVLEFGLAWALLYFRIMALRAHAPAGWMARPEERRV